MACATTTTPSSTSSWSSPVAKLTDKKQAALQEALKDGRIFQLPESRRHSPATLAALVKDGLLVRAPVGVIWNLTDAGRQAVQALNEQKN